MAVATRECYFDASLWWASRGGGPLTPAAGTPVVLSAPVRYQYVTEDGVHRAVEGGVYPSNPPVVLDNTGRASWVLPVGDDVTPRLDLTLAFEGIAEPFTVPPVSEFAGDPGTGACNIVDLINRGLPPPSSGRPSGPAVTVFVQDSQPSTSLPDGALWLDSSTSPYGAYVLNHGVWEPFGEVAGLVLSNDIPQPPGTAAAGTSSTASRSDHVHGEQDVGWDDVTGKPAIPDADVVAQVVDAVADFTGIVLDNNFTRETGVAGTDVAFTDRTFRPINAVGYQVEAASDYVLESDDYDDIAVRGSELSVLMVVDQLQTPQPGNHLAFPLTDGVTEIGIISVGLNLDDRPMVSLSVNRTVDGLRLRKLTAAGAVGDVDVSGLESAAALPPVADYSHGDIYLAGGVVYQLNEDDTNLIAGTTTITGRNPARVGLDDFEWGQDYYSVLVPQSAFAGPAPATIAGQFVAKGPVDEGFTADLAFMRDSSLDAGVKRGYSIRTGSGSVIESNIGAGERIEVRVYLDDARTIPLVIRDTAQWVHWHSNDETPRPQAQSDWDETDTGDPAYIENKPAIPSRLSDLDVPGPYPPLKDLRSDAAGAPVWVDPPGPADANSPGSSFGAKVATTSTLPTAASSGDLTAFSWTINLPGEGYTSIAGYLLGIPYLPRNQYIIGYWARAFVDGVEFDRAFLPFGPSPIQSDALEFLFAALSFTNAVNVDVLWDTGIARHNTTRLRLRGDNHTLPANSTVEIWEAVTGGSVGDAVDHSVHEATATLSLAAGNPGTGTTPNVVHTERDIAISAPTVAAGMGITIASNRVTAAADTPERLYTISYDIETEAVTFDNDDPGSGGNRLFVELYLKKNGVIDESTRRTHYMRASDPWSPAVWHFGGVLTEKLSPGDYITLHVVRVGGDKDEAGSKVDTWRINAAGSMLKIDTQGVSGGGGPGDPNQPAGNAAHDQTFVSWEDAPGEAQTARVTFAAQGSGATLYYRATNPFGASAGLVYLDYYPTSYGGGGGIAGTYVATVNLNVAATSRVPDLLRVVTRDYKFSPVGTPDSVAARYGTNLVATGDRVTASDLTKSIDVREANGKWKNGTAPSVVQRTWNPAALAQLVGEPQAVAAIVANDHTPVGSRFRLTHVQTIPGHGLLTAGATSNRGRIGWQRGALGTLTDADGTPSTGANTSGATPRVYGIFTTPSRSISAIRSPASAPTPVALTVNGIRYAPLTPGGTLSTGQNFEFGDGTVFTPGEVYAVQIEWSDGTTEWPDRVLQPGLYEWSGHAILPDPDNLSEASLAPFVKGAALAGGGRFGLDDLPVYVVTAAPSGDDPAGIYLTVA